MAARLERQLAEERELLASVSHELRTPLARIRLLVEIGRQAGTGQGQAAGNDPRTLDEIEREAIEIDALVGELLASARIEFQAVAPKPLDAVEVARRALERAGEDAAKLVSAPPPIPFAADPTLVGRALANLIDNARKHGSGLVRLTVRADGAGVTLRGRRSRTRLRARRREPRVRRSTGADPEGTAAPTGSHGSLGLGLALVKRIADAHGGRVHAANEPAGGARVVLELPCRRRPSAAVRLASAGPRAGPRAAPQGGRRSWRNQRRIDPFAILCDLLAWDRGTSIAFLRRST